MKPKPILLIALTALALTVSWGFDRAVGRLLRSTDMASNGAGLVVSARAIELAETAKTVAVVFCRVGH